MAHTIWIPREDRLGDLICSGSPDQIARAFHPQVDRIVRGTLRRPHDPDLLVSATSDALLAICRYRSGFRRESSASTWVHVIARRAAQKCAAREGLRTRTVTVLDPEALARIADRAVESKPFRSAEEAGEVLGALIPNPAWRRIWLLANDPAQRMSNEEIARRTGYTVASVGVVLSRVRRRLNRDRPHGSVRWSRARGL
jgi:DNA-directed RNA polymerase specialized sigma24 family protein